MAGTPRASSDLTILKALLRERLVPKRHKARVIVVGQDIFAVMIHAGSDAAYVDWRSDYAVLTYQVVSPPADVTAGVLDLAAELGLVYAALGFAITP